MEPTQLQHFNLPDISKLQQMHKCYLSPQMQGALVGHVLTLHVSFFISMPHMRSFPSTQRCVELYCSCHFKDASNCFRKLAAKMSVFGLQLHKWVFSEASYTFRTKMPQYEPYVPYVHSHSLMIQSFEYGKHPQGMINIILLD